MPNWNHSHPFYQRHKQYTYQAAWDAILSVSKGEYQGAMFPFKISFPSDYPYSFPNICFTVSMAHPLVDGNGFVLLDYSDIVLDNNRVPAGTSPLHICLNKLWDIFNNEIFLLTSKKWANKENAECLKKNRQEFRKSIKATVCNAFIKTTDYDVSWLEECQAQYKKHQDLNQPRFNLEYLPGKMQSFPYDQDVSKLLSKLSKEKSEYLPEEQLTNWILNKYAQY